MTSPSPDFQAVATLSELIETAREEIESLLYEGGLLAIDPEQGILYQSAHHAHSLLNCPGREELLAACLLLKAIPSAVMALALIEQAADRLDADEQNAGVLPEAKTELFEKVSATDHAALIDRIYQCHHPRVHLTCRSIKTGLRRVFQCQRCGIVLTPPQTPAQKGIPFESLPPFDTQRKATWDHAKHDAAHRAFEVRRAQYHDYLDSDDWKERRQQALDRAQGRCVQCGVKATEVHHLTYARIGCEHPADLIALCYTCHQRVHGVRR
ncbi:MAG: HNH endonuclease signature motif containing protein [Candidatus Competibacter denitrificans]